MEENFSQKIHPIERDPNLQSAPGLIQLSRFTPTARTSSNFHEWKMSQGKGCQIY